MFKNIALGAAVLSLITCGGWLIGQGMELSKARKALEKTELDLFHQKEVSMVLARDLITANKAASVDRVKASVNKEVTRAINGIDRTKKTCYFDADVWRDNIKRVRAASQTDSSVSSRVTENPDR